MPVKISIDGMQTFNACVWSSYRRSTVEWLFRSTPALRAFGYSHVDESKVNCLNFPDVLTQLASCDEFTPAEKRSRKIFRRQFKLPEGFDVQKNAPFIFS